MSSSSAPIIHRTSRAAGAPARVFRFSSPGDYYDAAATANDVDFGPWRGSLLEDIHFNGATRQIALARFRREVRNNPYLAGLAAKYPEAVGTSLLRSRTKDRAYNEQKDLFYWRWAKHACVDGRSLRKAERISLLEDLLAGELFIVLLASGNIQLVASEFCGSPGGATRYGDNEINGIVRDANNKPLAYRFGRLSRYGRVEWRGTDDELVPARYVIHDFDPDRVLLGRGIPRLLPSLKTFRDLYEITRSKTKQIKDANALSGFIKKQGAAKFLEGLNVAPPLSVDDVNATTGAESADAPADPQPSEQLTIELKPGMFVALEPGEEAQSMLSEYEATDYKELIMIMLHAGSAPVGLPVELWFSGLGDVNYSGFKGLGTQWKSRREDICATRQENFLDPLQDWRCRKAEDEGDLPRNPAGPLGHELVEYGWRRAAVLDDEKSARSNQIRLQTGESSHADIWEEQGKFPEEVFQHRRELYLKAKITAGEIEEGADHSREKVPIEFLFLNRLPGAGPVSSISPQANDNPPSHDEDEDDDESDDKSNRGRAA